MNEVTTVIKPLGLTPLQALDQLRIDRPELMHEKLSYAGRLDPMAEGVLLVLVGEANKEREKYLALDKVYEFEMVLGISTDSYDLMGMVNQVNRDTDIEESKLENIVNAYKGKVSLPYPPFSSKTVKGKPLWWWSRENRLDEIKIPINKFEVYELKILSRENISSVNLLKNVEEKIGKVTGDFRQAEIVARWKEQLESKMTDFPQIKCRMKCSSGTYVRSLVQDMGEQLGCGGVTYSIHRNRIGAHEPLDKT